MRLIDADVLLEKVQEIRKLALDRAVETPANMPFPIYQNPAYTRYSTQADEREKFKVMIEEAPSAQPERKTGRWTLRRVTYLWEGVECEKFETRCSSCERLPISGIKSTYCPNCGADMRSAERREDG